METASFPSHPYQVTTAIDTSDDTSDLSSGNSGFDHPISSVEPGNEPVYDEKERAEDAAFCKAHLLGRVVMEDEVEQLFSAMGGDSMVERYRGSHAAVRTRGVTKDEKDRIMAEFKKELKIRQEINRLLSKAAENKHEDSMMGEKRPEDGNRGSKEAGASSVKPEGGSATEFNEPGAKWLTEMSEMVSLQELV